MAELLILNQPSPADPRHFQRGDIVHVAEDGHAWGRREGLPDFVRARLPGIPSAQVQGLVAKHETTAAESASSAVRAIERLYRGVSKQEGKHITCRRYRVPSALMVPDAEGYIALTMDQIEDKKHAA